MEETRREKEQIIGKKRNCTKKYENSKMILKQIKWWINNLIEQLDALKTQKRKIEIQIEKYR